MPLLLQLVSLLISHKTSQLRKWKRRGEEIMKWRSGFSSENQWGHRIELLHFLRVSAFFLFRLVLLPVLRLRPVSLAEDNVALPQGKKKIFSSIKWIFLLRCWEKSVILASQETLM